MSQERLIVCSVGDTRAKDKFKKILQAIAAEKPDIFRFLGDTSYIDDNGKVWNDIVDSVPGMKEIMQPLKGNHEDDEEDAEKCGQHHEEWFKPIYDLKANNWLSLKFVKNAAFIAGNSQDLDYQFKRAQYDKIKSYLDECVKRRNAGEIDWIFIGWHKPQYTLKTKHGPEIGARNIYHPLTDEAQVDIEEGGHNHDKQWWKPLKFNGANNPPIILVDVLPDGTWNFAKLHGKAIMINGSGGRGLTEFKEDWRDNPNVAFADDTKFGYTKYIIEGKNMIVQFKDEDGNIMHEQKITKEGIVEPEPCGPTECKDPITNICREIAEGEVKDPNTGMCVKVTEPPKETTEYDLFVKDNKTEEVVKVFTRDSQLPEDKKNTYSILIDQKPNGPTGKLLDTVEVDVSTVIIPEKPELLTPLRAIVSTATDGGKGPEMAIDKNMSTRCSFEGVGETFSLEYDRVYRFKKLAVQCYHYHKTYFWSVGGKDFQLDAGRPENVLVEFDISDLNLVGKKFTITCNGNNSTDYNSFREVEVYGVPEDVIPPEPCEQGQCRDRTTDQCRPIGENEIVDEQGYCKLKPEPGEAVASLEMPSTGQPNTQGIKADASASVADTVVITQITNEQINLRPTDEKWVYEFDIPDKNNFSITLQAVATKGTSQKIIQKSIQVSTGPGGGDEKLPIATKIYYNSDKTLDTPKKLSSKKPHPDDKVLFPSGASGADYFEIKDDKFLYFETGDGNGRVYWDYHQVSEFNDGTIQDAGYNTVFYGTFRLEKGIDNLSVKDGNHGTDGWVFDGDFVFGGFGLSFHRDFMKMKAEYKHGDGEGSDNFDYPNGQELKDDVLYRFLYVRRTDIAKSECVVEGWLEFEHMSGNWTKIGTRTWNENKWNGPKSIDGGNYGAIKCHHIWTRNNAGSSEIMAIKNIRWGIPLT